jgi:hypothetical protein
MCLTLIFGGIIFSSEKPASPLTWCYRQEEILVEGYLSCNATRPGKSSPSNISNDAPPPVEMCVILSASPA